MRSELRTFLLGRRGPAFRGGPAVAADDPFDRARRGIVDRLFLAGRRRDPVPLQRSGLPRVDRRPGGAAPHPAGTVGWRRGGVALAAVLTVAAGIGISRLRLDDDLRALLRDSDAEFKLIDEVADRFGAPDRDCIVRVESRGGDLFDDRSLAGLRRLCAALREVPGAVDVRSILDVRRQGVAGAILPVIPRTDAPLDEETRAAARHRAAAHPLVTGHLLSGDFRSTLVLVRLDEAASGSAGLASTVHAIENVVAAAGGGDADLNLELTGLPTLRHQATQALRRDMLVFNSLGLGLAFLLSATAARSLRSTVVACVPPFVGAVWAMGVLGLCGVPVNILTSVVPSLALVVGTCDSIHFIEDMRRSRRRGADEVTASAGAIRRIGSACGLTSLVTAIGFASLAAARIEAVRIFGIAAAVGAVASFLAVTLLTPLLASSGFCRGLHLGGSWRPAGRFAGRLTAFSLRHARPIVACGCVATVALALVGSRIDADNRIADALPRGAAASLALERVDREFGGASGIDVVVRCVTPQVSQMGV
ncbi:MAG: hypothetical protein EBR28_11535 [Planctomycetia bacterium]|nr:hypothetical protein [Planctomycetia bacterium]